MHGWIKIVGNFMVSIFIMGGNNIPLADAQVGAVAGIIEQSGTIIRNGGDLVACEPEDGAERFNGQDLSYEYLSLDFLMTRGESLFGSPEFESGSLEDSLNSIEAVLAKRYPKLHQSFLHFRAHLGNQTDYSRDIIWIAQPHGLVDLPEHLFPGLLPERCIRRGEKPLIQAIIRSENTAFSNGDNPNKVIFSFDQKLIKTIALQSHVQLSFLLVHEWLWNFFDHPETLARANQFLHSSRFLSMPEDDLTMHLLGLEFPHGLLSSAIGDSKTRQVLQNNDFTSGIEPWRFRGSNYQWVDEIFYFNNADQAVKKSCLSQFISGPFFAGSRFAFSSNHRSFVHRTIIAELHLIENNGVETLVEESFTVAGASTSTGDNPESQVYKINFRGTLPASGSLKLSLCISDYDKQYISVESPKLYITE